MRDDDSYIGPYLPPGTFVRYDGFGSEEGRPEYGVVVHCWLNLEIESHDCIVAFFGKKLPEGEPDESPYILRYASTSLVILPDMSGRPNTVKST